MLRDIGSFVLAIIHYWIYIVCGSVIAGIMTNWSLFDQVPRWVATGFVILGIVTAIFLAGFVAHRRTITRLSIDDIAEKSGSVGTSYRITVRNLSGAILKVKAKLIGISPDPVRFPVQSFLRWIGTAEPHDEIDIEGHGIGLIEILEEVYQNEITGQRRISMPLANCPGSPFEIPWINYRIEICVFPISPDCGAATRRTFSIVCDANSCHVIDEYQDRKSEPPK